MFTVIAPYKEYIESLSIYPYIQTIYPKQVGQLFVKTKAPAKIESKFHLIILWIIAIPKILYSYKKLFKTTYVIGLHIPFFFVGKLFNQINREVVIDNFYVHNTGKKKFFKKMLKILLAGKGYTLIVQSNSEIIYFKEIAPTLTLKYLPYCMGKIEIYDNLTLPNNLPTSYLFSGGYTNRDYDLILKAAKNNGHLSFVIVMSRLNHLNIAVPDNVIVFKDLDFNQFHFLLSRAAGVIIPLKDSVGSSGQMLSLAAMQLGKPVIYSFNEAINHYFFYGNGISYEQNNLQSFQVALDRFSTLNKRDLDDLEAIQKKIFYENFESRNRMAKLMEILVR